MYTYQGPHLMKRPHETLSRFREDTLTRFLSPVQTMENES
jgi:hypothetical protein